MIEELAGGVSVQMIKATGSIGKVVELMFEARHRWSARAALSGTRCPHHKCAFSTASRGHGPPPIIEPAIATSGRHATGNRGDQRGPEDRSMGRG